jgi:hypothetical protein
MPLASSTTADRPAPNAQRRRQWAIVGLAALGVAGLLNLWVVHTNVSRYQRLHDHPVAVLVTVTDCYGNLSGSGSTVAGYTCHGSYHLNDQHFHEVLQGVTRFLTRGTVVAADVDSAHHSFVITAESVSTLLPPVWAPLPGLLSLVVVAYGAVALRRRSTRV